MGILEVLQQRSTAKSFDGRSIDPEVLSRILEVGRLAPSAKNRQTWRFIAITQLEKKEALARACFGEKRILQAGCIIAACTTNIQYTMPNGQPSHPLDIAFAVSHMSLQATHEGLGSIVLGSYDEQMAKSILNLPYSIQTLLLLAIGHTNDKKIKVDRLSRDRVISYEHW